MSKSPIDTNAGFPASFPDVPENRPPTKLKVVKAFLPMPRPGYPKKWMRSLTLIKLKRLTRTRIHRYIRRRFFYVKIHRRTQSASWQVFFRHRLMRTFTVWDAFPTSIMITTAVCIGNKQFRIASGGVQLLDNKLRFTITATDGLRQLGTETYPEAAVFVPFESCRRIWVTETNGAYAVMFLMSPKVFYIIEDACKRALVDAADTFEAHLTDDGYYSLVFEMPDNYDADQRNLDTFMANFIFMRKLMIPGSRFTYWENSVEFFNETLKQSDVQLMVAYNMLNNPVYMFRPISPMPLSVVDWFDENRPPPKEFVSIELRGREVKFYEANLVDLMGFSILKGQVVDFYLEHMMSEMPENIRRRVHVVSVFDLQSGKESGGNRDDFFKKDIVVIPIYRPNYWSFVILTNPIALLDLPESRRKVCTAVIVSTSLAKIPKQAVADLVAEFVQLRFEQLKSDGIYPNSRCNSKRLVPCAMGLASSRGFNDSGVFILQLVKNILNHLPEPAAQMRLTFNPEDPYMNNYSFRHAIRAAISRKLKEKERRMERERLQFPIVVDEEAGAQRRQDALAFWDFFIQKKDAEDRARAV